MPGRAQPRVLTRNPLKAEGPEDYGRHRGPSDRASGTWIQTFEKLSRAFGEARAIEPQEVRTVRDATKSALDGVISELEASKADRYERRKPFERLIVSRSPRQVRFFARLQACCLRRLT